MNRLSEESSLYLRQHASNPVHWQPWDESALEQARRENRPILLSIGYSACHWCHVMAHESFEDPATAEVMNDLFVNIKVDREERPDLDRIYQLSHQLLTGRGGGWPLTVFLDPASQVPFFAGTYFPRQRRYGMASFVEVLQAVHRWYLENGDEIDGQNAKLTETLQAIHSPGAGEIPDPSGLGALSRQAAGELLNRFDPVNGGFGQAPKFPQAPLLTAAFTLVSDQPDARLQQALLFSLEKMAGSGLRDHLDGGFFRYCVDATWTIPHFEKMLYDNAQLLPLYAAAGAGDSGSVHAAVAEGIVDWLERDMFQVNGACSASIDADADGEEGGFHVWRPQQVRDQLNADAAEAFITAFGLDQAPNFEGEAWHLVAGDRLAGILDDENTLLRTSVNQLRQARERRIHPTLDPKQITSWNALLASGLARAGAALQKPEWIDRSLDILDFIRRESWESGQLLAVHDGGQSRFPAYLDDHAYLLAALLDTLQLRWSPVRLSWALELAEVLLDRFQDQHAGGFYFTDRDSPTPMGRSLSFHDDATPSGNAVAAEALLRLSSLVGEARYETAAHRCLERGMEALAQSPLAAISLFPALLRAVNTPGQVLLSGRDHAMQLELQSWLEENYQVDCYVIGAPDSHLPGTLGSLQTGAAWTAWLCRGTRCLPPASDRETLAKLLEQD